MKTNPQTTEQTPQNAEQIAAELEFKYQAIQPGTKIGFWQIEREDGTLNVFFKHPSRMLKMIFFDAMQTKSNSLAAQDFLKACIIPENHPDVLDAIEPNGKPENDTLGMTLILKANQLVSVYASELKKK